MTNTLPDTLSALIRVGLVDLHKCEKDDKYIINMDDWHNPYEDGTCAVCLAGSVMAKTLNTNVNERMVPVGTQDGVIEAKLYALDNARTGCVDRALGHMALYTTYKYDRLIVDYEDDPVLFREQMSQLADDLEADAL